MNKQINQSRQSILSAAIATIFIFGATFSTFAQGIGAPYGAREPRTCADKTSPKAGALSAAKAAEYVICENEGINGDKLYFVEDVKVQVGAGRRYNPREDINFGGIDTKFLIYAIRGSYKSYQCTAIFPDKTNTNRNCTTYSAPNAEGACYKKSGFGEWRCMLVDINEEKTAENIPPPGAAKQKPTTDDRKTAPDNQTQDSEQKPKNKIDTKPGQPVPDFSEMTDWFDIVRYEYPKPPETKMWVYFKSKTDDSKPYIFYVEFRDKDGILVQDATYSPMCCSSELMSTAKGETSKVRIELPPESIMKQVTSIKIIRAK